MKTIAVSNQKGGVGKTTTATNLAYGLKMLGKRVLLVDCDPQGNSTNTYRASSADGSPTLSDLLFTDEPAESCIQRTEIGEILAGDVVLEDAETKLKGFTGYFRLKNRLAALAPHYDYCFLDTPPNLGILLQNALIAADGVIVPVTCSQYALGGVGRFVETVVDIQSQPNPNLKVLGLLLVKYSPRTMLAKDVTDGLPELKARLGTDVFETKIRARQEVENAQAAQMPLHMYSPTSDAAEDYRQLIAELMNRGDL